MFVNPESIRVQKLIVPLLLKTAASLVIMLVALGFASRLTLAKSLPAPAGMEKPSIVCYTTYSSDFSVTTELTTAGNPYCINGDISVATGITLTIDPGVSIYFTTDSGLQVFGTLKAIGNNSNMILFTTLVSPPAPNAWHGIRVHDKSVADLEYIDLGYAGSGYGAALRTDGIPKLTVRHSRIHDSGGDGLVFFGSTGTTYTITDSTFDHNSGAPIFERPDSAGINPTYTHLTFSGNSGGDYLRVNGGDLVLNRTFNGPLSFNGSPILFYNWIMGVPNGITITFQPGTTALFNATGTGFRVHSGGKLQVNGANGQVVTFTSDKATKNPGDWDGVIVEEGGTANLNYCDIGYGGHDYGAGLRAEGQSSLAVRHSHIHHNNGSGLDFFGAKGSGYIIADSTFDFNTGVPIYEEINGSSLNPTYTNLVFNGNGGGDFLLIIGGSQALSRTFNGPTSFNGKPIVFNGGGLDVPSGVTITIQASTVMQFTDPGGRLTVHNGGILQVNGSAGKLVTLTSDETSKSPGQWSGVILEQGGKAVLNYCDIGYAGHDFGTGLRILEQANLEVHHCQIHDNNGNGLGFFYTSGSNYIIADSTFDFNTGVPIYEETLNSSLNPTYTNLVFNGNGGGDFLLIRGGNQTLNRTFNGPVSFNGKPIAFNGGGMEVPDGVTITIQAGTVVEFTEQSSGIKVHSGGSLQAQGTGLKRVVFTSGQASKTAGDWYGLSIENGGHANLSFCEIGYAGHDSGVALEIEASDVQVSQCRIHHSISNGIRLNGVAASLVNNVVSDNQGAGLNITNGGSLVGLHTTIARNGTGMYVNSGTANLTNTILAGNTIGVQVDGSNIANLTRTLWDSNTTPVIGVITTDSGHINGPAGFAADGYHITLASAAIHAGVNAGVTIDIDGDPRPLPAGTPPDLGADEIKTPYTFWLPLMRH